MYRRRRASGARVFPAVSGPRARRRVKGPRRSAPPGGGVAATSVAGRRPPPRRGAALDARGVRTRPRAGQTLLRQGEPEGRLFLLEAGAVELSCVVESGCACVLDVVLPSELFGGWSAHAAPFSAIAREDCQVLSSAE